LQEPLYYNIIINYSIIVGPIVFYALNYLLTMKTKIHLTLIFMTIDLIINLIIYYVAHRIVNKIMIGAVNSNIGFNVNLIYKYPRISSFCFVAMWLLNLVIVILPLKLLLNTPDSDILIALFFILSGSCLSVPLSYFVSEKVTDKFLSLINNFAVNEDENRQNLNLLTKVSLSVLMVVFSIFFNLAGCLLLSYYYNLDLSKTILNISIAVSQGFIGAATVTLYLSKSIQNQVNNINKVLSNLVSDEGNLKILLPKLTGDENGKTVRLINLFIIKISNLIKLSKQQSENLKEVGLSLSSSMNETAAAVNEISANIQSIKNQTTNQSTSVKETSATMEKISSGIERLNNLIEDQSTNVTESSSSIEEMTASINNVTQTLINNSENIKKLSESSDSGRIDLNSVVKDIQEVAKESEGLLEVSRVIQGIASQTNLLAMNAAIEAAHAGDSGKGFSVVADEVRKLAESSGEQAKTVAVVLNKIKFSIEAITHSIENVLGKFSAIESEIKVVTVKENAIRDAMQEQTIGNKQILELIGVLNDITQKVKNGSHEMLIGSRQVIQENVKLNSITQEISNGMNEMSSGAEQITIAVNNVNELSEKNKSSIEALKSEIDKFKTD